MAIARTTAIADEEKVVDGKLEITSKRMITKDDLTKQKAAVATWRGEENIRHQARIDELGEREAEINKRLALLK